MLLSMFALLAGQTAPEFVPNAKMGTPYLLGYVSVVSGSKEVLDLGSQRWVTINSVRTALYFATKAETFVAKEGQKLVLLHCTIKNPSSSVLQLTPSDTFGVRIFDPGAVKGDYDVAGAVNSSLGALRQDLKKGESADLIVVLRAPAKFSTMRLGFYFRQQGLKNMRRYDLASSVAKPTSPFTKNGVSYSDTAEVGTGQPFELDAVEARVQGVHAVPGEFQYAVDVQVTNRTLLPAKWGWQYASASLTTSSGESVSYYPDFFDKAAGGSWSGEIPAGQTVNGEYRFSPGKSISAKSLTIKTMSTKRTVNVSF